MIERLDLMDLWPGNSKKGQTVSSFLGDKLTTSFMQGTSEISTFKERSHMLKRTLENYIKIGPKSFLGGH